MEEKRPDDPGNEGDLAFYRLASGSPKHILPSRERTEKTEETLQPHEKDRGEVVEPEFPISEPSKVLSNEKGPDKDRGFADDAKEKKTEMCDQNEIGG